MFKQTETNGVSYAIRLKANSNLYRLSEAADSRLNDITKNNKNDYAIVYDEFYYKGASWEYPRRVVVKAEKPYNQFNYQHAFIVTNMDLMPKKILMFYSNRGKMENFIKQSKTNSCPYQKEFYEILDNIRLLPKLE